MALATDCNSCRLRFRCQLSDFRSAAPVTHPPLHGAACGTGTRLVRLAAAGRISVVPELSRGKVKNQPLCETSEGAGGVGLLAGVGVGGRVSRLAGRVAAKKRGDETAFEVEKSRTADVVAVWERILIVGVGARGREHLE